MQIQVNVGAIEEVSVDAVIVSVFKDATAFSEPVQSLDAALDGAITALVKSGDFVGAAGQTSVLYTANKIPASRVIVVGLGLEDSFTVEGVRRASALAAKSVKSLNVTHVATLVHGLGAATLTPAQAAFAIVEGSLLALYRYSGKPASEDDSAPEILELIVPDDATMAAVQHGAAEAEHMASGVNMARDLVNMPPNFCTPAHMADTATEMADDVGLRVQVLERGQMQALGMGALLAVAQGSDTPPRFIIMEHNAAQAEELPSIVLVGKGVTFDTGGYNLKSGEGMATMKSDMAGGAAVIGAMRAIAGMDVPLHVVGLVPASDNMINGHAYRAQEVVTASNGVTIEIVSTDAEGRMLLADALVFAKRFKPVAVVDIATLTGACVVALGKGVAAGLFSTEDALRDALLRAGESTGEKLWPLPLFPEYEKSLESDVADMKHSGGRWGGVGASATFLKHFVDYPWAHVDMAGMAAELKDLPYMPAGASGFGARLLAEFVRGWSNAG